MIAVPNKLHDIKADLDANQVYSPSQIELLVTRYLNGAWPQSARASKGNTGRCTIN